MISNKDIFIVTLLSLQTVYNSLVSTYGQYVYEYFLDQYSQNQTISSNRLLKDSVSDKCKKNTSDLVNDSSEIWAQEKSADLIFQATLWRAFPVIIVTYIVGIYGTHWNRHIVLIVSIVGNTLHVIVIEGIIYLKLAEYWWFISALIAGLSGGTNVISIIINLIISEHVSEDKRSSYFVRTTGIATALAAATNFSAGYFIQWRGFGELFWIATGFELLSIVSVLFHWHCCTSTSFHIGNTSRQLESRSIFDIFTNHTHSRTRSITISLILLSYIFYYLAQSSLSPIIWYLLSTPFCWTPKDIGNFNAVALISSAIFSVLAMKIFTRCHVSDAIVCAVGQMCFFAYALCLALARNSHHLYLSLTLNPFSGYQGILTVPMLSKWLDADERSQIFTVLIEINTIILAFGTALFNWIYARTFDYQKNLTLFLTSGFCVIPFFIDLILFAIDKKTMLLQADPNTNPNNVNNYLIDPLCASRTSYGSIGEQREIVDQPSIIL